MPVTNEERAAWALTAVNVFRAVCRGSMEDGKPVVDEAVGDLIGDLLHLCDQHGIDPFKMIANGVSHYVCEKLDPTDGLEYEAQFNYTTYARRHASGEPWKILDAVLAEAGR